MKNSQKLCALLLSLMLTASMALTGCQSKQTDTVSNAQTSKNESKEETPKKAVHKLKILAPEPNHNKFMIWSEREEYPIFQKLQGMFDEQGLEIDYELVASEQFQVVLQTRMASANNLPDIANVSSLDNATVIEIAKQGTVLPLNDSIKKYSNGNIDKMYNGTFATAKALTLAPDGEMYWFSNLHQKTYKNEPASIGLGILLRKDWLDKLNLAVPKTIDDLTNVLTEFRTKDANGNKQQDEIFNLDTTGFGNGLAQYYGLGSDVVSVDAVSKKIVSPWYQKGIKDYFTYVQKLTKEKIIDSSLIGSSDLATQRTAENKVGAVYSYGMATWMLSEIQGVEGVAFQPLMPLKAVEGIKPAAILEPADLTWNKYVITKHCKDIEGAIKLFDVIYTDEYATMCAFGIEGECFEVKDGINYYIPLGTIEEQAKARKATGNGIWRYVYPLVQMPNLESELTETTPKEMVDFQLEVMNYDTWYPNGLSNFLAIPTAEETDEINKISNGINTYSKELATKLSLGQKSIDNWDEYMAEFEKLGLQKLIDIQQKQLDRYYAAIE